jgi:hypothetical protein
LRYSSKLSKAADAFQKMWDTADYREDPTALLEARVWLSLTLDHLGRGEKALNHLHDTVTGFEPATS